MKEFQCRTCDRIFDAEGTMKEYMSPVYGPCSKEVAVCPDCGEEATEKIKPKQAKNSSFSGPSCSSGGCCGCGV